MSRRRPALALLALLIALVGCTTTTNAPSTARLEENKEMATLQARAAYERGLGFLGEGRTGGALSALQDATRLDPSAALYANTMGVVLLQWFRQVNAALAWFARAVELDPSYGDAQLNFATALSEGGQWEPAVERYRLALRLPTLTVPHRAHQNLGVALYNLKRYREAEESLRLHSILSPKWSARTTTWGWCSWRRGGPATPRRPSGGSGSLARNQPSAGPLRIASTRWEMGGMGLKSHFRLPPPGVSV